MSHRPRLIKKHFTFKRTDGSKVEMKKHLKKCEEFKAPYKWTEVNRDGGGEDYMGNTDSFTWSLCCNGRALWCSSGPHDKKTLKALNDHQISPYQYNQTDWQAVCFPEDYIKRKELTLIHLSMDKKTFLADHAQSVRKVRRDIKRAQQTG